MARMAQLQCLTGWVTELPRGGPWGAGTLSPHALGRLVVVLGPQELGHHQNRDKGTDRGHTPTGLMAACLQYLGDVP